MAILVRTCCCGCDLKTGILLIGILGVVSTLLTNDRTHSGQPQTVPKTRVGFTHNVWFFNAADIYLRHSRPGRSACFTRTYEKISYRQALRSLTRNNFAGMAEAVKTTPRVSQMVFSVFQKPVGLIWSCTKNYLSVQMSQGELCSSRKFQQAFSSHPIVLATLEDMKQPFFHRKLQGTFCPKVLGDLF